MEKAEYSDIYEILESIEDIHPSRLKYFLLMRYYSSLSIAMDKNLHNISIEDLDQIEDHINELVKNVLNAKRLISKIKLNQNSIIKKSKNNHGVK